MAKVAIITGASSGIGTAAALELAKGGRYSLSLAGRNEQRLEAVAQQCRVLMTDGHKVLTTVADLADEGAPTALVRSTIDAFGTLDVLVNNAATLLTADFNDWLVDLATFDVTCRTNLRCVIELCNEAVPHLMKTQGCIVNIASVAGIQTFPAHSYGMCKAALNHYTKALALHLAPHKVRVNSICPAVIDTPILEAAADGGSANAQFQEMMKPGHPIGRIGQPEEVAYLIDFLADGDRAGFITGVNMPIDGGSNLPRGLSKFAVKK